MTASQAERYARLIDRNVSSLKLLRDAARNAQPKKDVSDWIVTIHFYILCVYVKCLGKCRGRDFQDHYGIRQWLNSERDLVHVARPYRKVEEWSRDARYEGRTFRDDEFRRFAGWFTTARDHFVRSLSNEGLSNIPNVDPVTP